ncbi:MAG: sulfite exporter TauE/SafE family protein [Pyrobaculum sp.]
MPLRYAAGASLIATSGGSSLSYIRRGVSNIRIAMSLSSTTTSGALIGSITATKVYNLGLEKRLYITFGVVLILSVFLLVKRGFKKRPVDKWTKWLVGDISTRQRVERCRTAAPGGDSRR